MTRSREYSVFDFVTHFCNLFESDNIFQVFVTGYFLNCFCNPENTYCLIHTCFTLCTRFTFYTNFVFVTDGRGSILLSLWGYKNTFWVTKTQFGLQKQVTKTWFCNRKMGSSITILESKKIKSNLSLLYRKIRVFLNFTFSFFWKWTWKCLRLAFFKFL